MRLGVTAGMVATSAAAIGTASMADRRVAVATMPLSGGPDIKRLFTFMIRGEARHGGFASDTLMEPQVARRDPAVRRRDGCICCSMKQDLATRVCAVLAQRARERSLIGPGSVADVAALVGVLLRPTAKPLVRRLHNSAVIDVGAFRRDCGRMWAPSRYRRAWRTCWS